MGFTIYCGTYIHGRMQIVFLINQVLSMVDPKKPREKVIVVIFKVSMHCQACEKTVAKVISKFKGVETFSTDMTKHQVTVKGRIDPEKILKKLKKKTGKRVEIVVPNNDGPKSKGVNSINSGDGGAAMNGSPNGFMFDDWGESQVFTMFSDENPNACIIM